MNSKKIKSLIIAGAVIVSGTVIPTTIANAKTLNTKEMKSSTAEQGIVAVNMKNNAALTTNENGGNVVGHSNAYDMIHVNKEGQSADLVTTQRTGEHGYISKGDLQIVKSGIDNTIQAMDANGTVVNVTTVLNVRENATVDSNVINTLTEGSTFKVVGKQGEWYKIVTNGTDGYVYDLFASVNSNNQVATNNNSNQVAVNNSNQVVANNNASQAKTTVATSSNVAKDSSVQVATNNNNNNVASQTGNTTNTVTTNTNGSTVIKPVITNGSNTVKPEVKPVVNPDAKPVVNPDAKPVVKPDAKPVVKPDVKPVVKPDVKPVVKPDVKPVVKPVVKPDVKPDVKPNVKPDAKPDVKPEQKAEATLNVKVVSLETGKPMANANVIIGGVEMKTNAKGEVTGIPVWANEKQHIEVTAKGYNKAYINDTFEANKTYTETVKIAPIPGNELVTVVNKETGKVLKDTEVNISGTVMKTDSKGQVLMANLWAGNQDFTMNVKGFKAENFKFTVESGKTGETTVKLAPVQEKATLNVKVVSLETGKPMANANVTIGGVEMKTNAKGEVTGIPVWANEKQHIEVGAKGYTPAYVDGTFEGNKTYTETVEIAPETCNEVVTILNKETGKALANTKVNISGTEMMTNAKGQVTMTGLWPGNQSFIVTTKGYKSGELNFTAVAGKTEETTVKLTKLNNKEASLTIKFVDNKTGKVMANTKVTIGGASFTTNAQGEVVGIPVMPNVMQDIQVGAKGFETSSIKEVFNGGSKNTVTVKLNSEKATNLAATSYADLTIKVVNYETGKPMANSKVTIGGAPFTTNAEGEVVGIPVMPNVMQDIQVSANGFNTVNVTGTFKEGSNNVATVTIAPKTCSEVVTLINMATGNPMANTKVDIGGSEMMTNAKGQVTMTGLWAGNQQFIISAKGFENATLNFKSVSGQTGETTVNVAPIPGSEVLTLINEETGTPMANINVDISGTEMMTNAKGQVTMTGLWAGNQNFTVSAKGFQQTGVSFTTVSGKQGAMTVNVAPVTCNEVVTLVNMATGEPIANTNVTIGGVQLQTNAKGQVVLTGLWAGNQGFTVSAKGYNNTAFNFKSVASKTGETTVKVAPIPGSVDLTLVNSKTGEKIANENVVVSGIPMKTNANGVVTLGGLWSGKDTFTISANGYKNTSVNVNVEGGKTVNVEANLTQTTKTKLKNKVSKVLNK